MQPRLVIWERAGEAPTLDDAGSHAKKVRLANRSIPHPYLAFPTPYPVGPLQIRRIRCVRMAAALLQFFCV